MGLEIWIKAGHLCTTLYSLGPWSLVQPASAKLRAPGLGGDKVSPGMLSWMGTATLETPAELLMFVC